MVYTKEEVLLNLGRLLYFKKKLNIFSDHNFLTLEINYMENTGKFTNVWRLSNILLNKYGSKMKSKEKFQKKIS